MMSTCHLSYDDRMSLCENAILGIGKRSANGRWNVNSTGSVSAQRLPTGAIVYFSYGTPVALRTKRGYWILTSQKFSVTTSKHFTTVLYGPWNYHCSRTVRPSAWRILLRQAGYTGQMGWCN